MKVVTGGVQWMPCAGPALRLTSLVTASAISTVMVNMECEREDSWFMRVDPTDLFFFPT